MKTHVLKTWRGPFKAIRDRRKRFEFRQNDRGYEEGDVLDLREWDEDGQHFTGQHEQVRVTYLITGPTFGIPAGFACMSIRPLSEEPCRRCGAYPCRESCDKDGRRPRGRW